MFETFTTENTWLSWEIRCYDDYNSVWIVVKPHMMPQLPAELYEFTVEECRTLAQILNQMADEIDERVAE